jgi:hypothetical protein
MGSNFWKRQGEFRKARFGMCNLHFVLQGECLDMSSVMSLGEKEMKALIEAQAGMEEEEEEEEEEEVKELTADEKAVQAATEKRAIKRIGQTILLIDHKKAKGEKLTSEENWMLQKAAVQSKAANMMYMRQSKAVTSDNKKEWYGDGLKRGKTEEEEALLEGDEEEEEESDEE